MIRKSQMLAIVLCVVILAGCDDPRLQESPNEDFWTVGLWGHGRGVIGDLRVNYFGVQRRCDTCHQVNTSKHGDLGTCNRCHQPHVTSWENSLLPRDHAEVFQLEGNRYHKKLECKNCHRTQQDQAAYKDVSCNHCHNHGKSDMDFAHELIDEYDYTIFSNNQMCRACHTKVGERYSEFYDTDLHELL